MPSQQTTGVPDAVVGALIGFAAALIVGFVGGWLQRSYDHKRWLRDKRQQIYAQAARELHSAAELALALRNDVRDHSPLAAGNRAVHYSQIRASNAGLQSLLAEFQVVASRRMRRMADQTFFSNEELMWYATKTSALSVEAMDERMLWAEAVTEFVDAARADLKAVGLGERIADVRESVGWKARSRWYQLKRRLMRTRTPEADKPEVSPTTDDEVPRSASRQ